jgi:uncharacterized RDD family membrane protein YckC
LPEPVTHQVYAGLVSRLAALSIDVLLLMTATITVRVVPTAAWEQILDRPAPGWLTGVARIAAVALPWAYFTTCWWLTGQTAGDLLLGIAVRHRNGRELSLFQAAARAAVGLTLAPLWLVGLLAVLWDERRRAWHDRLFRTVVCYRRRKAPSLPIRPHKAPGDATIDTA